MTTRSVNRLALGVLVCLLVGMLLLWGRVFNIQRGDLLHAPASGEYLNAVRGMEDTYRVSRERGRYVELYVENRGLTTLVCSIGEHTASRLAPGQAGRIIVEVTQDLWGRDRDYHFQVSPVSGEAAFRYEIVQRDWQ